MEELLTKIYYDVKNPASYGGVQKLLKEGKKINSDIKRRDVEEFLSSVDGYTLHKNVRFKFPTSKTIANSPNEHWQADLSDLSRFRSANDNTTFILFVIDVYSRYLWLRPLKNKSPSTVKIAFDDIFMDAQAQCAYLASDLGLEFCSGVMKSMLKERHIGHFHLYGRHKSAVVERVQRTIKTKMFRYFTMHNTHRYVDVLEDFALSYNKSVHRTIGKSPYSIYKENVIPLNMKNKSSVHTKLSQRRKRINVGDHVRISRSNRILTKGYHRGWSEEIFVVKKIVYKDNILLYYLEDLNKEKIEGVFYLQELQRVKLPTKFTVKSVLDTKGKGKNLRHFVSWMGYPDSFNSWVKASDVTLV